MKFDPQAIDRPDFGFFEKILGRTIERPSTPEAAHKMIEELLVEAFTKKPYDLVRAAGAKQLQSFWNSVGNRPDVKRESMDYLVSRLWERDPSGIPAKARGDKSKDTPDVRAAWDQPKAESGDSKVASTNAILFYRAGKHGVVGYLRQQVTWILSDLQTELAEQNRFVSTDHLAAQGIELASHGKFVRQSRVHDAAEEGPGDARDALTKRTDRNMRAEIVANDEATMERDGFADDEAENPDDLQEQQKAAKGQPQAAADDPQRPKYRALKSYDEVALRSKNRPDIQLFREELDTEVVMAPDPETRTVQLRDFARQLIDTRCAEMPERAEALAAVDDWPVMETPFQNFFVDVIEWINSHPKEMTGGTKGAGAPEPDMLSSVTQLEILSTPLLVEEQASLAQTLVEEGRLWRLHATPELLASPDRPDYHFLRRRLGYGTPALVDEGKRMAELQDLGLEFVDALFRGSPSLRHSFREEIQFWDPKKSLFNEEVAHVIGRLVEHDRLQPEEVQRVAHSFFSHYREAADPTYVAKLEAAQLRSAAGAVEQGYLLPEVGEAARRPRRERRAPTPRSKDVSPSLF